MLALKEGVKLPLLLLWVIWISVLLASIIMYLEITAMISFLINSKVSWEQLVLSEISSIFNRSLAIVPEVCLLKKEKNLIYSTTLHTLWNSPVNLAQKVNPRSNSIRGTSSP